jgi:hypothetical protein
MSTKSCRKQYNRPLLIAFVIISTVLSTSVFASSIYGPADASTIKAEMKAEDNATDRGDAGGAVQFDAPKELYIDFEGKRDTSGRAGQEKSLKQMFSEHPGTKCITTVTNVNFDKHGAIVNEKETVVTGSEDGDKQHFEYQIRSVYRDRWIKDKSGIWLCVEQRDVAKPLRDTIVSDKK